METTEIILADKIRQSQAMATACQNAVIDMIRVEHMADAGMFVDDNDDDDARHFGLYL